MKVEIVEEKKIFRSMKRSICLICIISIPIPCSSDEIQLIAGVNQKIFTSFYFSNKDYG